MGDRSVMEKWRTGPDENGHWKIKDLAGNQAWQDGLVYSGAIHFNSKACQQ
jgi:hypothetical protein